jgi:outer membrane scaffolding protein for murein synthesis (MipA/OmpV family)
MTLPCRHLLPTLLLLACAAVRAADAEPASSPQPISGGVVPAAASKAASEPAAKPTRWEGAIGPQIAVSPEYHGASRMHLSVTPGFFLRYGRLTFSNSSGFVTRRADDVFRGLGLDVVNSTSVRVNFSLRLDNGRRSAVSDKLSGIENVRHTIRMRSSGTWQIAPGWKAAAGWNTDLLGRGGGNVIDVGLGHDRQLTPRIVWNVGGGMNWGDSRYMRSYYGVSATESAASGYPLYVPGSGLRDVGLSTGFRMEISPEWMALWGASIGRVLGPAAQSPLTASTRQWSLNGGVAWRF